jgi:SAM-dependent methyltransferase
MKLNLGSGSNKIDGFVNIDINPANNPDVVCDILKGLPYETSSIDEIVLFHTIEHIEKFKHKGLFIEVRRVLKPDGLFVISYPEFSKCVQFWLDNKYGDRDFWEATVYGRQLFREDYHVCVIDSTDLRVRLKEAGLNMFKFKPEPDQEHNTIAYCSVDIPYVEYEVGMYQDMTTICK